jgi:hypothetical protein
MPVLEAPTMEEEASTDGAEENRPLLVKGHGHAACTLPFEAAQPIETRRRAVALLCMALSCRRWTSCSPHLRAGVTSS